MTNTTLEHWLRRLEAIHPREIELGLERVATVAQGMGLLPVGAPVVTVAGTNGKGSVVAVLEALLNRAGRCTGTFTSPHLLRFNERIRVAGEEVADAEIVAAFAAIDEARGDISLTYFEFSALAALHVFRQRRPEVVILEVGLGGRLDAVNIVDPTVSVITAIALDHQDWLGNSRDLIALEKAGILRQGVPVVVGDAEPPASLREKIEQVGAAPAFFLGTQFGAPVADGSWCGWVSDARGERRDLPQLDTGSVLPQNICTALQVGQLLDVEPDSVALPDLLQEAAPDGRRQFVEQGGVNYVLDVAHNPAAVNKLREYIDAIDCNKRKIAIFSAMSDKDIYGMIAPVSDCFDAWFIAAQPSNPRAADVDAIGAALRQQGQQTISVNKNLRQALRRAQSIAAAGDTLVVFGSFTTVAEAVSLLAKDRKKCEAV